MSVAKVVEIKSTSKKSFDDAITDGIARANKTLSGIAGAWVKDQDLVVEKGKVVQWRVTLKITFILKG